jgi:hypothetical protein
VPDGLEQSFSDPLRSFCKDFLSQNLESWPPREDALAKAFISKFPVSSFLMRPGVEAVCSTLGIEVSFRELPSELAGLNGAYEEKKEIVLTEKEDPLGIATHTLFHEIREIIERVFINLGHSTVSKEEMEERAEQFAIAVRANSAIKENEFLFENAMNISSNWLRWGSVALVSILAIAEGVAFVLLPQYEARISRKD